MQHMPDAPPAIAGDQPIPQPPSDEDDAIGSLNSHSSDEGQPSGDRLLDV